MLLLTLTLVNCQKDNIQEQEKTTVKVPPNLKATIQKGGKLLKANKTLNQQLSKLLINNKTEKNTTASRTIYSSQYNLSIDTTFIQLIETASYKSYTFIVERDNPNPDVLENYVLTNFNDDTSKQYIITYPVLNSSSDQEYDIANATIQPINDDILTYSSDTSSCASLVEYEDPVCVDTPCASGQHVVSQGDTCDYWGEIGMATQTCTGGGWIDTGCGDPTSGGGTTNPTDPTDTTNGGSPNTDPTVVVPLDSIECKKVNDMMNTVTGGTTLKNKIVELATEVNDVTNEHGLTINENNEIQNLNPAPFLTFDSNPSTAYKIIGHIHNNSTGGTYSVFSWADLRKISEVLYNNKLDARKFVATLSTSKGTHYAFTINDQTKFNDFFYFWNNESSGIDVFKWLDSESKADKIEKKYYKDKDNPIISKTDTDNPTVLKKFLDFMKEADMGITLFETDATFNNFSKVTKNTDGSLRRILCAN